MQPLRVVHAVTYSDRVDVDVLRPSEIAGAGYCVVDLVELSMHDTAQASEFGARDM